MASDYPHPRPRSPTTPPVERVLTDLEADIPDVGVPSGDPLDLLPDAPDLRRMVGSVASADELAKAVKATRGLTEYRQEAIIHAWLWGRAGVPDEAHDALEAAGIGIGADHPLRDLRDRLVHEVQRRRACWAYEATILWGAKARTGDQLYRQAGILLNGRPDFATDSTLEEIVGAWARSSGITHAATLKALAGMVQKHLLGRQPDIKSAKLSFEMVEFAKTVAGPDPSLQLAFFRALQRVAAYQVNGQLRWRSKWLRGAKANPDAIPGASTYSRQILGLLREHVFERIEGHRGGHHSATYQLKIPITTGAWGEEYFARQVGLTLTPSGKPRRTSRGVSRPKGRRA